MHKTRLFGMFLLLATTIACSTSDPAATDGAGPDDAGAASDTGTDSGPVQDDAGPGDAGWTQPFEPARCGAPAYAWLDPETMGTVLESVAVPEFSLDRESINDLAAQQGFVGIEAKYGIKLHRYRYETQDRGQKVEATALLSIPDLEGGEATLPYVLWLHGTSGWSDRCAASRLLEWIMAAGLMGSQGWIGVAPDYIGLNGLGEPSTVKHPYMVGEATALASWDAVRAAETVLKRVRSGITPDNRVVVWGGSQGGHATLFAERYAPHYAPGYEVVAALALVPPSNLLEDIIVGLGNFSGGLSYRTAFTTSFARWYGCADRLSEALQSVPPNDFANTIPETMDNECVLDLSEYNVTKTSDVFTQPFIDAFLGRNWAGFEHWQCMFVENSIELTSVPRKSATPVLWVLAENDELVSTPLERQMYSDLCAAGYSMNHLECKGAGHSDGPMGSLKEQIAWVGDRFAKKPLENPCAVTEPVCCSGAKNEACPHLRNTSGFPRFPAPAAAAAVGS
ncbi:MAG: alpha/beta fold hydrolase [Deltaproteobacteria bacterium]|nr:alpha/beta fold hydrolase [Deltaproteobacteria bacterium]